MMALPVFAIAVLGMAMLALSMSRHHRDLFGKQPSPILKRAFQIAGCAMMVVSLALAVAIEGSAIGPVLWVGLLTGAAQCVALMLTYRDRRRRG